MRERELAFVQKSRRGWLLTERVPKSLKPTISSEYRGLAQYIGLETDEFSMTVLLSEAARGFAERMHDGAPCGVLPVRNASTETLARAPLAIVG